MWFWLFIGMLVADIAINVWSDEDFQNKLKNLEE